MSEESKARSIAWVRSNQLWELGCEGGTHGAGFQQGMNQDCEEKVCRGSPQQFCKKVITTVE
jgi:hypothetical protein